MTRGREAWSTRGTVSRSKIQAALLSAALAGLVAPAAASAQERIYLANDDHTDYMWSGNAAYYRGAFARMLEYYMTQAETTAYYPDDARGRFNTDGTLWVSEYEATHTPAQFERLVSHLRMGTITMPLNVVAQLYGSMPAEAVIRSFAYAGRLERRAGLRFPLVVPMEDQTLPGGVASLWAGCGARYAWKGICNCSNHFDAIRRPRDVYHFRGPDGGSVLMKWNTLLTGSNQSLGGYAEARDPAAALALMRADPEFLARWPYDAAAAFGYGWDDAETTTNAFVRTALDSASDSVRVIVSNQVDFFEDFAASYGAGLGSYGAAFGNEWDQYTASLGEVTAGMRRSLEKLRTAEAAATIAALSDPTILSGRTAARDSMTMGFGLYYDHSFGPGPAVSEAQRGAWQRAIAGQVARTVDDLHDDALAALGAMVPAGEAEERHAVFNALSWARTDAADLASDVPAPRHAVDVSTGLEIPSQEVVVDGAARLRVLVSAVPSVGYRVVAVRPGAPAPLADAAAVTGATVDDGRYAVTLRGDGAIASLVDHADGDRELAATGALHALGAGGAGTVEVESAGPVSVTLRVVAGGDPTHETRVTLVRGVDRVAIEGLVTQNFGGRERWRYAFALPGAVIRHEEVGMIARVGRLAGGGDYADENTRTDALTLNHFVDLSQPARGVTVSSWDSQFFRSGNSTIDVLDAATPTVDLIVGMQTDGEGSGLLDQGGDTRFRNRYAVRAHGPWDAAEAMRFALEHQNPLTAVPATGGALASLPEDAWSFLAIDDPHVLLWALKPAEEGIAHGVIARAWNLSDAARLATLQRPLVPIVWARRTTHVETDLGTAPVLAGALRDSLPAWGMRTWRLAFDHETLHTAPPAPILALSLGPNPLARGGTATVRYALGAAAAVRISVHDVHGRELARIAEGPRAAGPQVATWDGRDRRGRTAPAGVYLVRLRVGDAIEARRLVLL